jgi:hypothetical protein
LNVKSDARVFDTLQTHAILAHKPEPASIDGAALEAVRRRLGLADPAVTNG